MAGKGSPKGIRQGGRQKGTLNKRTLELREQLTRHGCSIPRHIADLLDAPTERFPEAQKAEFLLKLLPFLHPQRKPIDPDGYISESQAATMQQQLILRFEMALLNVKIERDRVDDILRSLHPQETGDTPTH
jgi:hypothetical protein